MRQQGFCMSELLLYLALFALLATLLMRFVVATTLHLRTSSRQADAIAGLYTAFDWLAHDIKKGPYEQSAWHLDATKISWYYQQERISWKVKEGRLLRTIRRYDPTQQSWKRAATHIALCNVAAIQLEPSSDSAHHIDSITCTLEVMLPSGKRYTAKRCMALFDRVIV
jgi:type II secretory pathway pseudopilin PulG